MCVCVLSHMHFYSTVQFGSYTFRVAVIFLSMHHQALPPATATSSFWSKIFMLSFVQFLKTIPDGFESFTVTHTQRHTHIQPHASFYSSCHPELSVSTWAAGYTCESLLYDIGLKDLSLSSTFCYVE